MNETLKRIISGIIYISIMWFGTYYFKILLFTILGIFSIYEMYSLRKEKSKILSLLYITIPFLIIHKIPDNVILFMFILTWTFDTFAYLIGSKFGKNKILSIISPKKSWEGFFGGFAFTMIASYLTYKYFFKYEDFKLILIISISLPFTATIGDFISSYYKRKAKVKDSGNLIPGHGGVLDRMDAFTISIPMIYILINIIK